MADIVQGLWIGDALSKMEQLSIASFLRQGHEFHLYTYGAVSGVPPGTVVRDAEAVIPASRIFFYPHEKFYGAFSNLFRYKLLLANGGWWADVDMVCLEPFDFPTEHVFASEPAPGGAVPTAGLLRAPAGSAAMAEACEICESKDPERISWGETGAKLVRELLERHGLMGCLQPPEVFCPIPYDRWDEVLDPGVPWSFAAPTRGVHLWRQMWRRAGVDANGSYPPGCLYEQLKARYLPRG
ncbi:MAG TPA: hypothetical protein VKM72_07870 [Thermoanaerobaculia bacterium]|nr:hypothetical protein [Thermoanaerobaculia bacterium]